MRHAAWVVAGRRIASGAHRVFVRTEGSGSDVLFLHGFPTSSLDWAPAVAALRDRHRCVTPDFLGYGASDKPRRAYTYADQLVLVEAVARSEGLREVFLVAHDYGASVAQELLARHIEGRCPFSLRGVILLNGGIEPALHRALRVQEIMSGPLGPLLAPFVVSRRNFERSLRRVLVNCDAFDFDEHWAAVEHNDGARVLHRLLHYLGERRQNRLRWTAALRDAQPPIAFAWGLRDPISGAHMLDWARAQRPEAPVLALPVGHYPQLEATDATAAFIGETIAAWTRAEKSS